jgi:hypothetical protein
MENWNVADNNGDIDVPDHLMPLFNKIGMQFRLYAISGKNEIQSIADCVYLAEKFFNEKNKTV